MKKKVSKGKKVTEGKEKRKKKLHFAVDNHLKDITLTQNIKL